MAYFRDTYGSKVGMYLMRGSTAGTNEFDSSGCSLAGGADSRGGAVSTPTPTPTPGSCSGPTPTSSDSGSDGTQVSPDQTINLKEIDQGVRYRKGFKSLFFIVAPMLAREVRKRRYFRKFNRKFIFGQPLTGQIVMNDPESESR